MHLDADTCYRALAARDPRFDGTFFVGVRSTGIYCRPICPARTPSRASCLFFRLAAQAEQEGFRACFRCRPELAPGNGAVAALSRLAGIAVSRIEQGALVDGSVESLAGALGVSARHLRRAFRSELGLSPAALAQSRRMALAKQLLQSTSLPIAQVAFASGFESLRRFNAAIKERFGRSPSAVRRARGAPARSEGLLLRLDYRPPLDWPRLLEFLGARAAPGVEQVEGATYRRTVRLGAHRGWVAVEPDGERAALRAEVSLTLAGVLMPLIARLRRHFDLDLRPDVVAAALGADPLLARLLKRMPGVRVPGAFDGFELAVRAVLGQQVTVRAATALAGRCARAFGEPLETPFRGLDALAPTAESILQAGPERIAALGMPRSRAETLVALARGAAGGAIDLGPSTAPAEAMVRLQEIPGFGPWTAQYVALRALGWPDAFPASDLGIRKALGGLGPAGTEVRSERWRPWRAYAAMLLWASLPDARGEAQRKEVRT
jgi:AraC family transcriptional regulator of adaptative response / DNA-3-methyladenine glycosylase II